MALAAVTACGPFAGPNPSYGEVDADEIFTVDFVGILEFAERSEWPDGLTVGPRTSWSSDGDWPYPCLKIFGLKTAIARTEIHDRAI